MKRTITLMTMVLMINLLAFSAMAQDTGQCEPQGHQEQVNLLGPAPNSGDGVPDGSGWDHEDFGAPNSGDGIPDGSGWEDEDKAFIDEDGDGINDAQYVHDRAMTGESRAEIRGATSQGTSTGESSGTMNENFWSQLDNRAVDGGNGPFSDADGFGPAGDGVTGAAAGEPSQSGSGSGQGGKK
jgi:hypothetical protein